VSPVDPQDARIGAMEAHLAEKDERITQVLVLVGALT
jgi:transposase